MSHTSRRHLFLFLLLNSLLFHQTLRAGGDPGRPGWNGHLFEQKVFIENKGQEVNKCGSNTAPVLYAAKSGGVDIYFNSKGICYRYKKEQVLDEEGREELNHSKNKAALQQKLKPVIKFFNEEWVGANPAPAISAENEVSFYYTFPQADKKTIVAHAYRKIIYKNLYPHIDVEYVLPEDKGGIKYTLILHPGADLSQVKLKSDGDNAHLDAEGNVVIKSSFGDFTDHAPLAWYETTHAPKNISFTVKGNETSFSMPDGYDPAQTLVIDPWFANPAFPGFNSAYDVESDDQGNVYIYGGTGPFQLQKYNSAGTLIWNFSASPLSSAYYGDLAVDKLTGTTYLVEGYNSGIPAKALKVNTLGAQTGIFPGLTPYDEMWRVDYEPCFRKIVIGGGGTSGTSQGYILDTTMTTITSANVFNTTDNGYHDVTFLAMDPAGGFCYMADTRSLLWSTLNNVMTKVPMPALSPGVFQVADGYNIGEFTSLTYVNNTSGFNGFNGMAVSFNFLYTFNGDSLKKWNKNTGAFIAGVPTGGTALQCGGLAVDACDHLYVGVNSSVKVYDVNLNNTATLPLNGVVYDVRLGNNSKLQACGVGFVQQLDLSSFSNFNVTTSQLPASCTCTGKAWAASTICGNPAAVTYSWSPGGQTTDTISNLCVGNYTVTATAGCQLSQSAVVTVTAGPGSLNPTPSQVNESCYGGNNGTATVAVTGGNQPYTYSWSPIGGTGATATGLPAGTYTCTIHDTNGCIAIETITITQPASLSIIPSSQAPTCNQANGQASVAVTGGTSPYTYSWSPSGGTAATANNLAAAIYTCYITDATGCTQTQQITVGPSIGTLPEAVITPGGPLTFCTGNNVVLTASGGTSYSWSTGSTNSSITATLAGTYTLIATNSCGTDSAMVTVVVLALPVPSITGLTAFCQGDSSLLTAHGGGTYSWSTGATTASIHGHNAGTYTVTVSNGCGGVPTTTTITVYTVSAHFTSSVVTGLAPLAVAFTNTSSASSTSWSWNFGDNTTATTFNTTHTYTNSGTYTVTLTAFDSHGCESVYQEVIIVLEPPSMVTLPNVFTPNGDGNNDLFLPTYKNLTAFVMRIYDRWGVELAEINTVDEGWNGKSKSGNLVVDGTYYYLVNARGIDNKDYELHGFFMLIR